MLDIVENGGSRGAFCEKIADICRGESGIGCFDTYQNWGQVFGMSATRGRKLGYKAQLTLEPRIDKIEAVPAPEKIKNQMLKLGAALDRLPARLPTRGR